MSFYKDNFYRDLHERTLYPARIVTKILLAVLPQIQSAVDVGCAVGSWLSVLQEKGIADIQGLDGDWVNRDFLEIPKERFRSMDLSKRFTLEKKFDLAMSLEVAEHLPEESALDFVSNLTELSDFVLFSAAIPFQGGTNHVNEQWLEYWCDHFSQQGYQGIDIIRRKIWNDANIPFWYKQNLILFVRHTRVSDLRLEDDIANYSPISLVHPEQYLSAKVAVRIVKNYFIKRLKNFIHTS